MSFYVEIAFVFFVGNRLVKDEKIIIAKLVFSRFSHKFQHSIKYPAITAFACSLHLFMLIILLHYTVVEVNPLQVLLAILANPEPPVVLPDEEADEAEEKGMYSELDRANSMFDDFQLMLQEVNGTVAKQKVFADLMAQLDELYTFEQL